MLSTCGIRILRRKMIQLYFPSVYRHRIFAAAAVSVMALLFVGIFLYQAHADSLNRAYLSDNVFLSAKASRAAPAAVPETRAVPAIGEVHIANNGLVLLRGARVISIADGTIHVGVTLGSSRFLWAVKIDNYSKFLTPDGQAESLSDIKTGGILTVTGRLSAGGPEPTIGADFVREQ